MDKKIKCINCEKDFLVIKPERDFYKKKGLPLPDTCFFCRSKRRNSLRNRPVLFQRTCDKCGISISTAYSPDRPESVYCEKCYLESIH